MISIVILYFLVVSCSSPNVIENNKPAQSIDELQAQLEYVLKDMHIPGMSIAIVNRDKPEWIAGLGKADLAHDRLVTETTLFRIGSVSKGFVSLAVLMLANEGKLSLEDPLQKLAPEVWFENAWEASDPVRLVHLLENTTGWDDMHLREFAKNPSTMSSIDALNYDHSSRISRWRPGTRMAYCNSGPAVAAYIVEKTTGKRLEEYVEQNLFKPIGMETATYFQPISELTTTLYHTNGKTPHLYWHLLYRPIGSINASAKDMANYLLFYLNSGTVQGAQILPASLFKRLEASSSTWAANEGLSVGYGLGNYCSIYDGFVYHGHDGNVPGGLTVFSYLPEEGIGYFFSINSENRKALKRINAMIRAYITRNLQKPNTPPIVSLSEKVSTYSGWYEPNSPRMKLAFFLERLFGITYIHFEGNKLLINSLSEKNATFFPVSDTDFLYAPVNESIDPASTLKLLKSNSEGQFIQISLGQRNTASLHITMKHIPSWLAIFEIVITGFVLLAFVSILVYTPFWILRCLKNTCHYHSEEFRLLLWPQIALISLLCIGVICMLSSDLFISRLGNLTIWSLTLFLATIVFAVASMASIFVLWRNSKEKVHITAIYRYSIMITIALVITTAYLTYWNIIGLRTWQ